MKGRGFTLVELAIVLVIIGIILGAVLKGTELINNSKAKRVQNDLKGLEAAMWTFYDRMGRFPGDCNNDGIIGYGLPNSVEGPTPSNNADPTTDYCATAATSEGDINRAFSDLRVQRILPPNSPNANIAKHAFNHYFAIGSVAIGPSSYNAIAIYNIPTWAAKMIDISIDGQADGSTGRVRRYDVSGFPAWPEDAQNDQPVSLIYFIDKLP